MVATLEIHRGKTEMDNMLRSKSGDADAIHASTQLVPEGFGRRAFLQRRRGSATAALLLSRHALAADKKQAAAKLPGRPKVAAIFTEFTHRSHAHVILENFLNKYYFNGKLTDPGVDVVSFYADQMPDGDLSKKWLPTTASPRTKPLPRRVTLGTGKLAVDAVLSIGEHGKYPTNELGQYMYPRKRFFDEIVAVMKKSNRFVPLYNDKHLSYRFDWAREMYDTARELGIPLMAGSSVPLAQRQPMLELPPGAEIEEAVSVHGGGVESYDFHCLEVLQSMVEARRGGETGVSKVEFLDADALWKAAREKRWSLDLAQAAMEAEFNRRPTELKRPPGDFARFQDNPESSSPPHGVLLTYKDGLKGLALKLGASSMRWNFACRLKGDPKIRACSYYVGPWQNRNLFKALSHAIQHHFIHKKAPYPVERTLLVAGILDVEMHSRKDGGRAIDTPELEIAYAPVDFRACAKRETRGKSSPKTSRNRRDSIPTRGNKTCGFSIEKLRVERRPMGGG